MTVARDVEVSGERFALIVETEHDGARAMTAIHRQRFAHRQGGVRFVDRGTLEELAHLARGMTEKCAASRVPLDGLKCLIVCPDGPRDVDWKASVVAEHLRAVIEADAGAVFGPDMGCPEEVLSRVAERPELLHHVTGLSARWGGLEINRRGYTAFGVVQAIELALDRPLDQVTFAIQGFGAVGAHTAELIAQRGGRVVAVCNANGTLVDERGLQIASLLHAWRRVGDDCLDLYRHGGERTPRPEAIFEVTADVFVPAARTSVLAARDELATIRSENRDVCAVDEFYERARPRLIAEAANHPLTERAEEYLEARGVTILPDVLINCGGMIACYAEFERRRSSIPTPAELEVLDGQCRKTIQTAISRNVLALRESARPARQIANEIIREELGITCSSS